MKSLEKDILLIVKGWYDKTKYETTLDALNAYYHREYGCEDIVMDKRFANHLFLAPTYIKYGNIKKIFEPSMLEHLPNYNRDFDNVMYDRLIKSICEIKIKGVHDLDFSDYQDMFDKAKACDDSDETIGLI